MRNVGAHIALYHNEQWRLSQLKCKPFTSGPDLPSFYRGDLRLASATRVISWTFVSRRPFIATAARVPSHFCQSAAKAIWEPEPMKGGYPQYSAKALLQRRPKSGASSQWAPRRVSGEGSARKRPADEAGLCVKDIVYAAYATFTSIALGLAFSDFGRCRLNTPSLNSAFALSSSITSGNEKVRAKLP